MYCPRIRPCLTAFIVICLASVGAAAVPRHYVAPSSIDVRGILAGPPPDNSSQTRAEVQTVLALQARRTAADAARTEREGRWSPQLFAEVFGPWFNEKTLPRTFALLDTVGRDTMAVAERAKKQWFRSRPPVVDPRVHPSVGLPKNSSYPSGHGAYGLVLANVLSELAPDLAPQLLARGRQIGDDRVLGGVHFPSDIEAGRALAPAILRQLHANPAYAASLDDAKAEFDAVRAHFSGVASHP